MERRYYVLLLTLLLFVAAFIVGSNINSKIDVIQIDDILFDDNQMLITSDKFIYVVPKNTTVSYKSYKTDKLIMYQDKVAYIAIAQKNAKQFNLRYAMAYNAAPKTKK